jgi:hypothetical protein
VSVKRAGQKIPAKSALFSQLAKYEKTPHWLMSAGFSLIRNNLGRSTPLSGVGARQPFSYGAQQEACGAQQVGAGAQQVDAAGAQQDDFCPQLLPQPLLQHFVLWHFVLQHFCLQHLLPAWTSEALKAIPTAATTTAASDNSVRVISISPLVN